MDWLRALVAPPASASSPRPELAVPRREPPSPAASPGSRWDFSAQSPGSRWDSEASVYERGHRRVPSLTDLSSSASLGGTTTPERHVSTRPRGSAPPSPANSPGPTLLLRAQKGGSLKGSGRQFSGKGYRSALLGPLHQVAYLAALLLLASAMALSWHALFYKSLLDQMQQQQQPFLGSSLATADLLYPDEGAAATAGLGEGRREQEQERGGARGAGGPGQGERGDSSLHTRLEVSLEVCKAKLLPCSPVLLRCAGKRRRQRLLGKLLPWGGNARSLLHGAAEQAAGGALGPNACRGQRLRDCKLLLRSCRDVSNALKSLVLAASRRQAQAKALSGATAPSALGSGHVAPEDRATPALAAEGLLGASATVRRVNCTFFNRNWRKTCLCPGLAGPESMAGSMGACQSRSGQQFTRPRAAEVGAGAKGTGAGSEGIRAQGPPVEEGAGPGLFLGEILLARGLLARASRLRQKGKPASDDAALKGPGGDLVSMLLRRSRTRDPLKAAGVMAVRDTVRDRVFESCAVVGDSALMLAIPRGAEIDAHEAVFRFGGASPTLTWQRYVGSKTTVRVVRPQDQRHVRELPRENVIVMAETSEDMRAYINFRQFDISRKGLRHFILSPGFMTYAREVAKVALRMRSPVKQALLRPVAGTPGVTAEPGASQGSQQQGLLGVLPVGSGGAEGPPTHEPGTEAVSAKQPEDEFRRALGSQGSPGGPQGAAREGTSGEATAGAGQGQGEGDGEGDGVGSPRGASGAEGLLPHQSWSSEGSAELRTQLAADQEPQRGPGDSTGGSGPSVPAVEGTAGAARVTSRVAQPAASIESAGAAGAERGGARGPGKGAGETTAPESASSDRPTFDFSEGPALGSGSQNEEGPGGSTDALESQGKAEAVAGAEPGRETPAGGQESPLGEAVGQADEVESGLEGEGVRVSLVPAEEGLPGGGAAGGEAAVVPEFHPEQDPFLQDSGETVEVEEGATESSEALQPQAGQGAGAEAGAAGEAGEAGEGSDSSSEAGRSKGVAGTPPTRQPQEGPLAQVQSEGQREVLLGAEGGAKALSEDQGPEEEGEKEIEGENEGDEEAEGEVGQEEGGSRMVQGAGEEGALSLGTPSDGRVSAEEEGGAEKEEGTSSPAATAHAGQLQAPGHARPAQGRAAPSATLTLSGRAAMEVEPELARPPVIQPLAAYASAQRHLLGLLQAAGAHGRRTRSLNILRKGSLGSSGAVKQSEGRGAPRGWTALAALGVGRQGGRRALLWMDGEEEQGAEGRRLRAKRHRAKARKKAKAKGTKKKVPPRLAAHAAAETHPGSLRSDQESSSLESTGPGRRAAEDGVAVPRQQRLKKKKKKAGVRRRVQAPLHESDELVTPPAHQAPDSQAEAGASAGGHASASASTSASASASASASVTASATASATGSPTDPLDTTAREEEPEEDAERTDSSDRAEDGGPGAALEKGASRVSSAQGPSASVQPQQAQQSTPLEARAAERLPVLLSESSASQDTTSRKGSTQAGASASGSEGAQVTGADLAGVPAEGQEAGHGEGEGRSNEGENGEEGKGSEGRAQRGPEAGEAGVGDAGAEEVGSEEEGVTEGWVALLLALNTCKQVSVYGWPTQGSLKLGSSKEPKMELPEKYSSRCPPGRASWRATEANDRKRLRKLAGVELVRVGMPCMMECFSPSKACNACITKELSITLLLEGLSQWRQLPAPSYCTTALQAKAQLPAWMETGLPGDA